MKRDLSLQQTQVFRVPPKPAAAATRLVNMSKAAGIPGGVSKMKSRNPQMQTQIARKIASKAKNNMFQNSKVQKRAAKKETLGGYPLAAITQALLEASAGIGAAQKDKETKNNRAKGVAKPVEKKPMKSRLGVQARLGAQPSSGPSRNNRLDFSSSFANKSSNMSSRLGQRQNLPGRFSLQRGGNLTRKNFSQGFQRGNNFSGSVARRNNQSERISKRFHQPHQFSGQRSKGQGQRRNNYRRGFANPW